MIGKVAIATLVIGLLAGNAAHADSVRGELEKVRQQVQVGIGGFEGSVKPFEGVAALSYGASENRPYRFRAYLRAILGKTAVTSIAVECDLDIETRVRTDSNLRRTLSFESCDFDVGAPEDVQVEAGQAIPDGTKAVTTFDATGSGLEVTLLPPVGDGPHDLPQPGTQAFEQIKSMVGVFPLVRGDGRQDEEIFGRLLYFTGVDNDDASWLGDGPTIRGETDCLGKRCLVVEIDEAGTFFAGDVSLDGRTKGHMLIERGSLQRIAGMAWGNFRIKREGSDTFVEFASMIGAK